MLVGGGQGASAFPVLSSSRRHRLEVISQSVQKVKEQPFSRLVLCLRPAGQGRLRQHKHRTTKSDSFWEDAGHADVATGRGGFSLRSFISGAFRFSSAV
ncbi:hypothetical protein VL14_22905 [Cytobacillus firmus]|nr:hypothetical protein VL14_22905 [Cytobacillus firmus]